MQKFESAAAARTNPAIFTEDLARESRGASETNPPATLTPVPEFEYPHPAGAWWAVVVLQFAAALSYLDRTILSMLVTPIKADLHISDTEMSFLIGGGFALVYIFVALPMGQVADRLSRKRALLTCVSVWTLATAAGGLATSYATLFITRMFLGAGESGLNPCGYSMTSDLFPRKKLGLASAIVEVGRPVGAGIALMGGAAWMRMLENHTVALEFVPVLTGWRLVLVSMVLPSIVVIAMLLAIQEPSRTGIGAKVVAQTPSYRELLVFLKQTPSLVGFIVAMGLFYIATQSNLSWLPTMFERNYGIPPKQIGTMLGLISAGAGALGLFTGGTISDALFKRGLRDVHVRLPTMCALLLTPVLIVVPLMPTSDSALTALTLQLLLSYAPMAAAIALIQMAVPNRLRGKVVALTLVVQGTSALFVGPTLTAAINDFFYDGLSLAHAISWTGGLFAPLAAILLLISRPGLRCHIVTVLASEQAQ